MAVPRRRPKLDRPYRRVPTLLREEQSRQQRISTIRSKIVTRTWQERISGMNRHSSNVTYGYYGADNCHDYGRDSGDDGINDTTNGRNDGTL